MRLESSAMTAATGRNPRSPWKDPASPRTRTKPSSTPNGFPPGRTPASVGQPAPPRLSPLPGPGPPPAPPENSMHPVSPGYFGRSANGTAGSPVDSDAGPHAKGNWKSASSSIASKAATSPQPVPHDQNPDLADFRRQSEAYAFNLGNLQRFNSSSNAPSASSPLARNMDHPPSAGYFSSPADADARPETDDSTDKMDVDGPMDDSAISPKAPFNAPRLSLNGQEPAWSPGPGSRNASLDEYHHRLSFVDSHMSPTIPAGPLSADSRKSSTSLHTHHDAPSIISAEEFADLYDREHPHNLLILDLRVAPQYAKSRIKGALNLCIPTTLLKRPSFSVPRLSDAFTHADEKTKFARWTEVNYIAVYDASSATIRDATSAVNTLRKFVSEGWKGSPYIIRGGFEALTKEYPRLVETPKSGKAGALNKKGLKLNPSGGNSGNDSLEVAGGCPMPAQKSAANPFFGNIRQNMDLIGGVGQMEIKLPEAVNSRTFQYLPSWLQQTTAAEDKGKKVSEKFLEIEKAEQKRMQAALSGDVQYGDPSADPANQVRMAGIEKGEKNRYKDILPFDHSRVKLEEADEGGDDYINASYLKAAWSNRKYITTQAPLPGTFQDFWRMVWEQDVRVVVMLTAEKEGNQQKAHAYWVAGDYGPMKVKALSEKRVALVPPVSAASKLKRAQTGSPMDRPTITRRRGVTNPLGLNAALQETTPAGPTAGVGGGSSGGPGKGSDESEISQVLVRRVTLQHANRPFEPLREITQLHFSQWPDFGSIAAQDVLGLVEQCSNVLRVAATGASTSSIGGNGSGSAASGVAAAAAPPSYLHPSSVGAAVPSNPLLPAGDDERPIVVHCSAGCGRTGTFCAIDSVIDMLKRQRMAKRRQAVNGAAAAAGVAGVADAARAASSTAADADAHKGVSDDAPWIADDSIDLVAAAVQDFRLQRLSMVQTLKQFVLCYEAVAEWWVKTTPEKFRSDHMRRSSEG